MSFRIPPRSRGGQPCIPAALPRFLYEMRVRTPWLILAFWTVLGLLESSKAYLAERLRGAEGAVPGVATGWDAALIGNMPWWLLWAVLTAIIFRLSAQFRLDGPRWAQAAAVHLGAGTALSALHVIVAGTLYYYTNTRGGPIGNAEAQVGSILDSYLVVNLMTYWAVVGA